MSAIYQCSGNLTFNLYVHCGTASINGLLCSETSIVHFIRSETSDSLEEAVMYESSTRTFTQFNARCCLLDVYSCKSVETVTQICK